MFGQFDAKPFLAGGKRAASLREAAESAIAAD